MIVLIGTVPHDTGVYTGPAAVEGAALRVGEARFPVERGTAAMAAACAQACRHYGLPAPVAIFGGDVGDGRGTDLMFAEVSARLGEYAPDVIVLHYLYPKIRYGEPFLAKVDSLPRRPQLIADAGGMYLMKTIGRAARFDVFTPDQGELLFLADELAPHPLYVRRELIGKSFDTDALVQTAVSHGSAPRTVIVKGEADAVYRDGVRVVECRSPMIPAMEAIGGTGDTITGMLAALRGRGDPDADVKALVLNRLIGQHIKCTPATQIKEFIAALPAVLAEYEKGH